MNPIVFSGVSLRLNVLAVLKILARSDLHQSSEVAVKVALISETNQHGSLGDEVKH